MTTKTKIAAAVKEWMTRPIVKVITVAGAYEDGIRAGIQMAMPKGGPEELELPEWLERQDWLDFCEHRRVACKTPMTLTAGKRMLSKLDRLRQAGHPPALVIDQSINSGKWTDIYPLKDDPMVPVPRKTYPPRPAALSFRDQQKASTRDEFVNGGQRIDPPPMDLEG